MFKKMHNYVSEADKFLKGFDQKQTDKSAAQQAEIAKHDAIAKRRDEAVSEESSVWGEF